MLRRRQDFDLRGIVRFGCSFGKGSEGLGCYTGGSESSGQVEADLPAALCGKDGFEKNGNFWWTILGLPIRFLVAIWVALLVLLC